VAQRDSPEEPVEPAFEATHRFKTPRDIEVALDEVGRHWQMDVLTALNDYLD
jgi:hypothetical protein